MKAKGTYPGAKGVVFDILNEIPAMVSPLPSRSNPIPAAAALNNNPDVCIYLNVMNEVIQLPIDQLRPVHPSKAKDKFKVIKGKLKCIWDIAFSLRSKIANKKKNEQAITKAKLEALLAYKVQKQLFSSIRTLSIILFRT